jgi:hypothetical protein
VGHPFLNAGLMISARRSLMKKEISIAIMATILVLQLIGSTVGGIVGKVADELAETLSNRIQIEQMIQSGDF